MPSRRYWIVCLCALLLCFVHVTTATTAVSRALNETIDDEGTSLTTEDTSEEHDDLGTSEEHGTSDVEDGLDFPLLDGDTPQSASSHEGDEAHEGEEHEEPAHAVLFPSFSLTIGLIVFFLLTR